VLRALLACAVADERVHAAVSCARALASAGAHFKGLGPIAAPELTQAVTTVEDHDVRWFLLRALNAFGPAVALPQFRAAVADPRNGTSLRANVLGLLSAAPDLAPALDDESAALRATALGLLAALPPGAVDASVVAQLHSLSANDRSSWVKGQALVALAHLRPDEARPLVTAAVGRPDIVLQEAAIGALGTLGSAADVTLLFQLLESPVIRVRAAAANAISSLGAAQLPANARAVAVSLVANAKNDPNIEPLSAAIAMATTLNQVELGPALEALYPAYLDTADIPQSLAFNGRISLLSAFAALSDQPATPLVRNAVDDPIRIVGLQAATSYQQLTGIDLSPNVRLNNVVREATPPGDEIEDALAARVMLVLRGGRIVLKMLPDAPVTAAKFVARVRRGFYDGLIFHRVIPGFVAQGGDPLGLGSGGDKKFVRDEVSSSGHRRGTVGIATAGKDTGDSQIFINLADNPFLDDSYTVFAAVESGIESIDRIQLGDPILRAFAY
jgi:cyclophilin family peptidyl-prolyl cis-trans isomerase/HEAT repeat protein